MEKQSQWRLLGGLMMSSEIISFYWALVFFLKIGNTEIISSVQDCYNTSVFFVFLILNIRLIASKKEISFLSNFERLYPSLSDYLSSIGWIAYLTLIAASIFIPYLMLSEQEAYILPFVLWSELFTVIALIVSLFLCSRNKRKQHNSC